MQKRVLRRLLQPFGQGLAALKSTNPAIRAPLAISFGAIPGALSRYYLTLVFTELLGTSFPYGTFVINLSGALIMGFFATLALEKVVISPDLRLMIAVGFLGAYTTFSTYTLDTVTLIDKGHIGIALSYWVSSATLGIVSLEIGSFLARRLP